MNITEGNENESPVICGRMRLLLTCWTSSPKTLRQFRNKAKKSGIHVILVEGHEVAQKLQSSSKVFPEGQAVGVFIVDTWSKKYLDQAGEKFYELIRSEGIQIVD